VYFYQLGLRLTLQRLTAGGESLGFGSRTGIDLPSERRPDFPVEYEAYLNAKYGKSGWTAQSVALNMSIGQGENSQTVLTMARFYAALATDGSEPQLRVAQGNVERKKVINLPPDQMERLRDAMVDVLSAGGTAAASAIQGVTIAGKTGTAQSGRFVNGVELNHGWFAGIAPAGKGQQPKIVVIVMLEYGGHGSRAAHIASAIIGHYLKAKTAWTLGDQG
jgi:penicillin-binding protein 2